MDGTTVEDTLDNTKSAYRSSIVYKTSGSIDLLFLLTTTYDK